MRCGCGSATALSAGAEVLQLTAGAFHACALLAGGSVRCWGSNAYGELATGATCDSPTPVAVRGLESVIAIAAGYDHTCAVLSTHQVMCWGSNSQGQLGNGINTTSSSPQPPTLVLNLSDATGIAAQNGRTCAVLTDRTVQCWGWDTTPATGGSTSSGGQMASSVPVPVSGLHGVAALAAGDDFMCALIVDGSVECWGSDIRGQLGDGSGVIFRPTPVSVLGIPRATAVAAGGSGACALGIDGTVWCWGDGSLGELGTGPGPSPAGSTSSSSGAGPATSTPVLVQGVSGAVALAAGDQHRCAANSDGTVQCWGWNALGQLGDGAVSDFTTVPVAVSGLRGAVQLAAGYDFTCAALPGGIVQCWGDNVRGNLGDGTFDNSAVPVTVHW